MSTINYDQPVVDLIAGLNATGHVTHESFKKTSVTFHHNGGVNVSHQGVLDTWKYRAASAHFDVDSSGSVAQYVDVNEYAWAVGNTGGNESSISIEQADASGSPDYVVGDATWKAACRLAAWLFIHVIGEAPSSSNIFPHQHWSSTDCPGPWVTNHFGMYVSEVQSQYAILKGGSPSPSPTPSPASNGLWVDGKLGFHTISRWQEVMGTPQDGVISPVSDLVAEVQRQLNLKINAGLLVDGRGIRQDGNYYHTAQALQKYLGTTQDGVLSVPVSQAVEALQTRLNKGSF